MIGEKIASITVSGWTGGPVSYLAPHSFKVENGMLSICMASTTTSPRTWNHYPLNALKFFQVTLGD